MDEKFYAIQNFKQILGDSLMRIYFDNDALNMLQQTEF